MGGLCMSNAKAPTYLIVCFRYIGDVLVTTPLALSIKTAQPEAEIDYLVFQGTEAVLAKNPSIRAVHTIPPKKASVGKLLSLRNRYDVAIAAYPSDRTVVAAAVAGRYTIGLTNGWRKEWWKHLLLDMHYVCYDRLHVVQNMLMPLRILGMEPVPRLVMACGEEDRRTAQALLPAGQRCVVLHPYSRNRFKCWGAEYWGQLARLIREQAGCLPFFTVTNDPADQEYLQAILACAPEETVVLAKPCNLNQLAALLGAAAAYVGSDTLVTHMAAAQGVPVLALYGPSWTRYWAPWPADCASFSPFVQNKGIQHRGNVTVVQMDWECVPCNKEFCRVSTRNKPECLESLTPEMVFKELACHGLRTDSEQPV